MILVRAQGYNASVVEVTLNASDAANAGFSYQPSLYEQATANNAITLNNAASKYQLGVTYYNNSLQSSNSDDQWNNLRAAIQVLQNVVTNYATDTITPLAQLQLAYCLNAAQPFSINSTQTLNDTVTGFQTAVTLLANSGNTTLLAPTQMQLASCMLQQALMNEISYDSVRSALAMVGSNYPTTGSGILAQTQLMIGETYYYQKNYTQASTVFNNLLNQYPVSSVNCAYAQYWQNQMLSDQKNYAAALQGYTAILNTYQNQTADMYPMILRSTLFGQAWCLRKLGQNSTAQQVATQLMALYPNTQESQAARIIFWQRNAEAFGVPTINGQPVTVSQ